MWTDLGVFALFFSLLGSASWGETAFEATRLLVEEIGPRPVGSAASARAAEEIASFLEGCGLSPQVHRFDRVFRREIRVFGQQFLSPKEVRLPGRNVWARVGPEEAPAIVVGAHYDSVSWNVPGARDNAASVGVVLATACALAPSWRGSHALVFVAFDGEEEGLLGSAAFVRDGVAGKVSLAVSLDMTGSENLAFNGLSPLVGAPILKAAAEASQKTGVHFSIPLPMLILSRALPSIERSDHGPFTEAGIPAFQLFSQGEAGFDPHYHAPTDTLDRISPEALEDTVLWLTAFLTEVDEVAGEPGDGRFFPLLPSRGVWLSGALALYLRVLSLALAFAALLVMVRRSKPWQKPRLFLQALGTWALWMGGAFVLALVGALPFYLAPYLKGLSVPWFGAPGWYMAWGASLVLLVFLSAARVSWVRSWFSGRDRFFLLALFLLSGLIVGAWALGSPEASTLLAFPLVAVSLASLAKGVWWRKIALLSLPFGVYLVWPGHYQVGVLTWTLPASSPLYLVWASFVMFLFGAGLLGARKKIDVTQDAPRREISLFVVLATGALAIALGLYALLTPSYSAEYPRRVQITHRISGEDGTLLIRSFGGERLDGISLTLGEERVALSGAQMFLPYPVEEKIASVRGEVERGETPGRLTSTLFIEPEERMLSSVEISYRAEGEGGPVPFRVLLEDGEEILVLPPLGFSSRWYGPRGGITERRTFLLPEGASLSAEIRLTIPGALAFLYAEGEDVITELTSEVRLSWPLGSW